MARKQKFITIDKENRDHGKVFRITEMDAWDAYDWASRVFFALMNTGVEIPEHVLESGMAGLAAMTESDFMRFIFGMMAKIPYQQGKPILDHLLTCVEIQPDPLKLNFRSNILADIEEPSTFLTLQKEAFSLHFGFFGPGVGSTMDTPSQETDA